MKSHVRLLAVLQMVFGALGLLTAIGMLLLFGGIAAIVGVAAPDEGKFIAIPVLGAVGTFVFLIIGIVSLPELIAGIGLWREREWGRILSIIVCAIGLFNVPIGTAIGIYGLWVLLSNEGASVFAHRSA